MITFLFWNLNQKHLPGTVANLVVHYQVDVLMLAECVIAPANLLMTLNQADTEYYYASGMCKRIELFTRFPSEFVEPVFETDILTIRHLVLPGRIDILLAVTHLPSKLHWSEDSQALACVGLANRIADEEQLIGHSRTVLVGDLNMNPFESGVVSASGLHGVMCREIARKSARTVHGQVYPFFYNPMWSLLGDASPGVPGTYHYSNAEPKVFFWNMFDQVLIRPALLNAFRNEELAIVQHDGTLPLLSASGLPDKKNFSDHLPIMFKLHL